MPLTISARASNVRERVKEERERGEKLGTGTRLDVGRKTKLESDHLFAALPP